MPRPLPMSGKPTDQRRRLLEERLSQRDQASRQRLFELVQDAELVGSLALAGIEVAWEAVRASRAGGPLPEAALVLRQAQRLSLEGEGLDAARLMALCQSLARGEGLRVASQPRSDGPPTAPPERISSRLAALGDWLRAEATAGLAPAAAGALVLARLLEIAPLASGNGRLSRLAAGAMMASRGGLRPLLVAGDAARLRHAVGEAFEMKTAPLAELLDEASGRTVEVMLQAMDGDLDRAGRRRGASQGSSVSSSGSGAPPE